MKKIKKLMLVVLFLMFGLVLFSCEKKTHGGGLDLLASRLETLDERVRKLETDKITEKHELEKRCEKFKQELETLKQDQKDLQEKKLVNLEERLKITEQKIALLESVNYETQMQELQTKNAKLETEVLALKEELTKEVWIPVHNVSYLWVKYEDKKYGMQTYKIDITFGDTILYNPKTGELKITVSYHLHSFNQEVIAFGMWGFGFEK